MTKKLLTLAAGAMILAPMTSFADTANVNVYGTLNFSFDMANATNNPDSGKDTVARWRLISNSSNFGIKGEDNITENLKAFFQVENSLSTLLNGGGIADRNTAVGLKGDFGTTLIGQWDTPYKVSSAFAEPFYGAGVGYMVAVLDTVSGDTGHLTTSNAGFGTNPTFFFRRMGQSLQYWSPKWMGVSFRAMYSANISRVSDPAASAENADMLSGSVSYDEGPITAAFAYEQHDDTRAGVSTTVGPITALTATNNTKDTGIKAAAGYKLMDTTTINGVFSSLKYRNRHTAGEDSASKTAFMISIMHKMGDWNFRTGFGMTGDMSCTLQSGAACDVSGSAAKQLALGGSYSLSKRTDVYGLFAKIWNEGNVAYNFVHGTVPNASGATTTGGADPMSVGVGVRHTF